MDKELKLAIEFLKKCYSREKQSENQAKEVMEQLCLEKGYSPKRKITISKQLIADILTTQNEIINQKIREEDLKERGVIEKWNLCETEPEIIEEAWKRVYRQYSQKNELEIYLTEEFIRKIIEEGEAVLLNNFHDDNINQTPHSASEYHHQGNSYHSRGDCHKALKSYETAISLEIKSPSGKEGLYRRSKAEVLSELNRTEDALKEYRKAIEIISTDNLDTLFSIHLGIARIMKKESNYKDALRELSIAISFFKNAFAFGKPKFERSVVWLKFPKGKLWNVDFIFSEILKVLSEVEKIPVSNAEDLKKEKDKILSQASLIIFKLKDWELQSAIES